MTQDQPGEQRRIAQASTGHHPAAGPPPRVEFIDNWHVKWRNVLEFVDRAGHRTTLHINDDGWLSARQNLAVAFIGENAVGHLCFRVQPVVAANGQVVLTEEDHKPAVEAYVECVSIADLAKGQGVTELLVERAKARAADLQCRAFRMEDAGSCELPV